MIDGFYTLNIALQDLIGQPQFEMVISFRVSFHKNSKRYVDETNFTFTIVQIKRNDELKYQDPQKVFPLKFNEPNEALFLQNFLKIYHPRD